MNDVKCKKKGLLTLLSLRRKHKSRITHLESLSITKRINNKGQLACKQVEAAHFC